jgi:hypothetical protein
VKTGVQGTYNCWKELDSGFRRNDGKHHFLTFYEFISFEDHPAHGATRPQFFKTNRPVHFEPMKSSRVQEPTPLTINTSGRLDIYKKSKK